MKILGKHLLNCCVYQIGLRDTKSHPFHFSQHLFNFFLPNPFWLACFEVVRFDTIPDQINQTPFTTGELERWGFICL